MLEVVRALATATGLSLEEVDAIRRGKAADRGTFDEGLLLESVSYPDRPDEAHTNSGDEPHQPGSRHADRAEQ